MRPLLPWLLLVAAAPAFAISTTFTYQGQLFDAGQPAQASYDLQFELQTQAGAAVGAPLLREDVAVQGGLFAVELDFGPSITGADYQLRIGVRPAASTGAFTLLAPVTKIRPTPQAQVAGLASEAVTVTTNSISSTSIADGSVVAADIDATQIQRRVQASCAAGESIRAIASDGMVTCNPAAIYGDGSRGDFVAAPGLNFLTGGNLQFNNITIPAGSSLFVPSGALLKALGNVTIQGNLNVNSGAQPSSLSPGPGLPSVPVSASYFGTEAHSGGNEDSTTAISVTVQGRTGPGARAPRLIQSTPAHYALHPTYLGGGAGGNSEGVGAEGGGFSGIVARGSISISGAVTALGGTAGSTSGAGGGGGGLLVLASRSSIQNSGTLNVSGGAGGNGGSTDGGGFARAWGAGGGGGGGLVHLLAPSITAGTVLLAGGSGGTAASPIAYAGATDMQSVGGGGGGGSYGRGANGSLVNGQTSTRQYTWGSAAQAGDPGLLIQTLADPSTLF
jgi:hypothetical protein